MCPWAKTLLFGVEFRSAVTMCLLGVISPRGPLGCVGLRCRPQPAAPSVMLSPALPAPLFFPASSVVPQLSHAYSFCLRSHHLASHCLLLLSHISVSCPTVIHVTISCLIVFCPIVSCSTVLCRTVSCLVSHCLVSFVSHCCVFLSHVVSDLPGVNFPLHEQ